MIKIKIPLCLIALLNYRIVYTRIGTAAFLVGYLYITGNDDRLKEIMRSVTEREREGFDE